MSNPIKANILPKLFVLTIILAGFLVLTTSSALAFTGTGSGTDADPYQITNIEELQEINDELTASYELQNNLDFCDSEVGGSYDTPNTGTTSVSNYCEEQATTTAEGWDMIAHSGSDVFQGVFDGGNYIIENLYINKPEQESQVGFIRRGNSAVVKNVGFEDAKVTSDYQNSKTGIVIGEFTAGGVIENVYTTGSVENKQSIGAAGGLAGKTNGTRVENSYSSARVTAPRRAGGLVGVNDGGSTITNSYASGMVTTPDGSGSNEYDDINGFVGFNLNGSLTAQDLEGNYWDIQTSGQHNGIGNYSDEAGITGISTPDMFSFDTFSNDWDIGKVSSYNGETWKINDGQDYPRLGWQSNDVQHGGYTVISPAETSTETDNEVIFTAEAYDETGSLITKNTDDFTWSGVASDGVLNKPDAGVYDVTAAYSGTASSTAYITVKGAISSIEDLREIGKSENSLQQSYVLTTDLDFCDSSSYETSDTGTTSVSNYCKEEGATTGWDMWGENKDLGFTGTLDGRGHIIKNLYINTEGMWGNGLIRHTDQNATIKDLGVVDAEINDTGGGTGILVGTDWESGSNRLTMKDVFTTGSISSGYGYVGGLIGAGYDADISNSYTTADITIDESSSWPVAAGLYGGFWGNGGNVSVTNSYAAGSVVATTSPDEAFFYDEGSDISLANFQNNFFDTEVNGHSSSIAATGKTTAEMKSLSTFSDTSTEGLDSSWDIAMVDSYDDEAWVIEDGSSYPQLAWHAIEEKSGDEEADDGGSSGGGSGGFLVNVGPSAADDTSETDADEDEEHESSGSSGGSDDGEGDSDESDDEAEENEGGEEKEESGGGDEEEELSRGERISRLVQDVSELQQDTEMTREEKITRFRDILVELVDILSNS